MIYGFTGKAQSGKNTCVKIWQVISQYNEIYHGDIMEQTKNAINDTNYPCLSYWQQKSFAHKLKEVVSVITGCKIEDLEDNDFKNSLAPKFNGQYQYTYRELLQFIGTDLFRNQLGENVWINALFTGYEKPITKAIKKTGGHLNSENQTEFPKWLVSDVRFQNEANAVKARGGKIIRVIKITDEIIKEACNVADRETSLKFNVDIDDLFLCNTEEEILKEEYEDEWNKFYDDYLYHQREDKHISETEQDDIASDYTIIAHEGDIESLIKQTKDIMIKEGVIIN